MKLNEGERVRMKNCVANIKDKMIAIEKEINQEYAHKSYILEKIESVCWDSNCIKSICEKENI